MIDLIAIDPGNEGGHGVCALAFFERGALVELANMKESTASAWTQVSYFNGTVVRERPEIYPGEGHSRPNDIVKLADAGALVAGAFHAREHIAYTPHQWKGNQAKPVCHHFLWQALTPYERALFPNDTQARIAKGIAINAPRMYAQPLKSYAFKAHNLLDAAAIGCKHLGRI